VIEVHDAARRSRARHFVDILERLEGLADPSVIEVVREVLCEPNNADKLARVGRAIHAVHQLKAVLDQDQS
jgi:hypothetical protein